MNDFCKHCGLCCQQEPRFWYGSPLVSADFANSKINLPDISGIILNKSGCCEMLSEDNLCMLQLKFGYDSKPNGCKDFSQQDCDNLRNKQCQNMPTL
jgi:hypothetical protein